MAMQSGKVIALIICVIIVTLTLIAYSYPQGEEYLKHPLPPDGLVEADMVDLYIGQLPSPATNPLWVRILQDYSAIGIISFVVGVFVLIDLTSKKRIEPVFNVRGR